MLVAETPLTENSSWHIYALGDDAITVDFGNSISPPINQKVIQLFTALQNHPLHGMIEAVPAYSTVTIFYDMYLLRNQITGTGTVQQWITNETEKRITALPIISDKINEGKVVHIPVCYDATFAPDMDAICSQKKLSPESIIQSHTSQTYRVYMPGFLPGFAYMGETAELLNISRKQQPVPVAKGSVGLAGRQTGIYPTDSPGGWQIIGRTPLIMFDALQPVPILLQPGDTVQFYSITSHEFANY